MVFSKANFKVASQRQFNVLNLCSFSKSNVRVCAFDVVAPAESLLAFLGHLPSTNCIFF
jgi:hypothetical protein